MALGKVQNVRWERLNDTDMILRWDKVSGATKYQIAYQKGSTGRVTDKWVSTSNSFTIRRWGVNGGYALVVKAWDNKGNSGAWSDFTGWFYTPPPTPAAPTVTLRADGALVKWSRKGSYYTSGTQLQREGGSIVTLGNGYDSGRSPEQYLDETGGTGLRWRVRGFVGRDTVTGERVYGGWSAWSKPVDRLVPPNAPLLKAPVGFAGSWVDVVFSWVHSPRDTSAQTGAEVRYRLIDDELWTTRAITGSAQTLSVNLGVGSYEWQARTKGLSGEFGPWAAVSVFAAISQPVVTLTKPDVKDAKLTASWLFEQAEGLPQSEALVTLLSGGGIVEQRKGTGPATSTTFTTVLKNNTAYQLQAKAATSGLWSAVKTQSWTTSFVPPPAPILSVAWDDMGGMHIITVAPGMVTADTKPTTKLDLERNTGDSWETVATGLTPIQHVLNDFEALTWGLNQWRATAWTSEGASAQTTVDVDTRSYKTWIRWNNTAVAIKYNPDHSYEASRHESELVFFDGMDSPTLIEGQGIERKVSVGGTLLPQWINEEETDGRDAPTTREVLEDAITTPGQLVRLSTPDRIRIEGVLTASFQVKTSGITDASITVEEAV